MSPTLSTTMTQVMGKKEFDLRGIQKVITFLHASSTTLKAEIEFKHTMLTIRPRESRHSKLHSEINFLVLLDI